MTVGCGSGVLLLVHVVLEADAPPLVLGGPAVSTLDMAVRLVGLATELGIVLIVVGRRTVELSLRVGSAMIMVEFSLGEPEEVGKGAVPVLVLGRRDPGTGHVKSGIEPSLGFAEGAAVARDETILEESIVGADGTAVALDEAPEAAPDEGAVGLAVPKRVEGSTTGNCPVIGTAVGRIDVDERGIPEDGLFAPPVPVGALDGVAEGLLEGVTFELFGGADEATAVELFGGEDGAIGVELFGGAGGATEDFGGDDGAAVEVFGGAGGADDGTGALPLFWKTFKLFTVQKAFVKALGLSWT